MNFEEELFNLSEQERAEEKQAEIELEGSELLQHLEDLGKVFNEVADIITSKETILCEDADIIDNIQMDCIKQLGEIIDTIQRNT